MSPSWGVENVDRTSAGLSKLGVLISSKGMDFNQFNTICESQNGFTVLTFSNNYAILNMSLACMHRLIPN